MITSPLIGGQGTYTPEIVVTDTASAQAKAQISFAMNGSNAFLANVFTAASIFHHRVDAATTNLPVDTSPAAPMYSGYLPATVKPFFGNNSNAPFPNGIPAIEVPYNQPDVSVATTVYQSVLYFGTDSGLRAGGGHEQLDRETGTCWCTWRRATEINPALYEMWQGIYLDGPWTDSSNAEWPNVASDALTPQGQGTSDAAGLPVAPLLANADEVIGTGTPSAPNGYDPASHPIHAEPYVELLGVAGDANGGHGELHQERRGRDFGGVGDFAGHSAGKLHHDRDQPAKSTG